MTESWPRAWLDPLKVRCTESEVIGVSNPDAIEDLLSADGIITRPNTTHDIENL